MFKRLCRKFFRVPKYEKMTDQVFKSRIALSVLTIIVCWVVFCATTFAWFTSQQTTAVSHIESAEYSLTVELDGEALDTEELDAAAVYNCPLATEDCHTFTITATGTATTGYCEIEAGDEIIRTVQISPEESITLTVVAKEDTEISFSAIWGTYQGKSRSGYGNRDFIEISRTPYQLYTVAGNVTLADIAEYYDVPADDILLYNGISEWEWEIEAGRELKIPNTTVTEPLVISEEPTGDTTEYAEYDDPDEYAEYDDPDEYWPYEEADEYAEYEK